METREKDMKKISENEKMPQISSLAPVLCEDNRKEKMATPQVFVLKICVLFP